jgi:hypothetical protein
MTYLARFLARLGLVGSLMGGLVVPAALSAQQATVSTASRTEWGDPDLEGTWLTGNTAGRPFQRPTTPSDASLLAELVEGGAIERYNRLDEDQSKRTGAGGACRGAGASRSAMADHGAVPRPVGGPFGLRTQ